MKVVQTGKKFYKFSEIKVGDVFMNGVHYFMKVHIGDSNNNAICLNDGDADYFMDSQNVLSVDCELVVK